MLVLSLSFISSYHVISNQYPYDFNMYKLICTCSAAASSMAALKQPTIRVVAIIAEGVPESDTKQLIAYARSNNKVGVEIDID